MADQHAEGEPMGWRLFLDDKADEERDPAITVDDPLWRARAGLPPSPPETGHLGPWVIARSHAEAVAERGFPDFVSFDHDLADGADGIRTARMLVDLDLDDGTMPDDFGFEVHSGNPVGAGNIRGLLEAYVAQREAGFGPRR